MAATFGLPGGLQRPNPQQGLVLCVVAAHHSYLAARVAARVTMHGMVDVAGGPRAPYRRSNAYSETAHFWGFLKHFSGQRRAVLPQRAELGAICSCPDAWNIEPFKTGQRPMAYNSTGMQHPCVSAASTHNIQMNFTCGTCNAVEVWALMSASRVAVPAVSKFVARLDC